MFSSRADLIVDLTWLATLLAPIVTLISTRWAVARHYHRHRVAQVMLLGFCWTTVLAFETLIRLRGGSGIFLAAASDQRRELARRLLLAHISGAVLTYLAWSWLAVTSWRRFRADLPGRFSRRHRRVGWLVFAGLCFTSASATGMYLMAFVL
jgi:surfactin synthase thioesterase subunit